MVSWNRSKQFSICCLECRLCLEKRDFLEEGKQPTETYALFQSEIFRFLNDFESLYLNHKKNG